MKKTLLLCLTLSISLWAHAQATDLVVDCQTPGWLSSKINYGDQQTVKNLKVTGYINSDDLKFIGRLIGEESLNGHIDLSEVNLVGNKMDANSFSVFGKTIQRLDLPKSVKEYSQCLLNYSGGEYLYLAVDTLVFDPIYINYVRANFFDKVQFGKAIKNLVVGENVDSIPSQYNGFWEYEGIESIYFKGKLRYIGDYAFNATSSLSQMNFEAFDSLEYIGYRSLIGNQLAIDTLYQPKKLADFPILYFPYGNNAHIFFDTTLKSITGSGRLSGSIFLHFKTMIPPTSAVTMGNTITIHVPKGAKDAFLNDIRFKEATIIEDNPVESITLNEHSITLNKNEQFNLSATILPEDADDKSISWESKDTSVASIDEHGTVTAIKEGETQVVVTSIATGIQDQCTVLVRKNVTNISLEEDQIFFNVIGEQKQLVAIITPDDATEKGVTWKSFNEQVCTVSDDGLVTATGIGSTLVTATTVDGGLTVNCVVKVIQHVGKVSLNKVALELKVNESEQLIANVSPDNADNKALTWSSSNNQVATVDANGNVQALKAGDAWIKAVSVDNTEAKDSCKLTVIQPVTGITISQPTIQFTNIGENIQLEVTVLPEDASNKEVTWTSSNESVCMVANGMVVATGYGTAVVMAITKDGGFMASCSVIVEKETIPVTGITLSQTSATLKKGETLQLEATVTPDDATNKTLIWKSSDETKCVVTQLGLLVALTEGQAIITVIPENGVGQAQCNVLIVDEGSSISTVSVDASKSEMPIYDIMGQRVLYLMKGHLYICNGKKFIAK